MGSPCLFDLMTLLFWFVYRTVTIPSGLPSSFRHPKSSNGAPLLSLITIPYGLTSSFRQGRGRSAALLRFRYNPAWVPLVFSTLAIFAQSRKLLELQSRMGSPRLFDTNTHQPSVSTPSNYNPVWVPLVFSTLLLCRCILRNDILQSRMGSPRLFDRATESGMASVQSDYNPVWVPLVFSTEPHVAELGPRKNYNPVWVPLVFST